MDKRPDFYEGEPVGVRHLADDGITVGVFVSMTGRTVTVLVSDEGKGGHYIDVDRGRVYPLPRMEPA